jgi:formate dehydrogenase iron-sulfur subunit
MTKAILYDATLCVGCLQCEVACAEQNKLTYNDAIAAEKKTSAHKFTYVMTRSDEKYMRKLCMHCVDPACASVCPVGAMHKTALGPVVYDVDKCMGCRYCMLGCPFGVPKYEWSAVLPRVRKCTMCYEARTSKGMPTACSEACPTGATISGERDELLAEAAKRIRENKDGFNPKVFGEHEVGGTSVFMLSSIPFEQFSFKSDYTNEPLPQTTWRVLSKIPDIASFGFVMLGGIWWITNRRNQVALAEYVEKKREMEKAEKEKGGES